MRITSHYLVRNLAVFGVFISFGTLVAQESEVAVQPEFKTKIVELPLLRLDQLHSAMTGPVSEVQFAIDSMASDETVWIRRFRVDVVDENGDPDSSEFLCHSMLEWIGNEHREVLSISQGMEDMIFPAGFGVPVEASRELNLEAMGENNSYPDLDQSIGFRATIEYFDEASALRLGIRPLETLNLMALPKNFADQPDAMSGHTMDHGGMWMVPPGMHVYRAALPKAVSFDATIHFIKVHLHPYGTSINLWDATEDRLVWAGSATNHGEKRWLLDTEHYSSSEGIELFQDHEYQLEVTYDNPSDSSVDAMGVLRLYVARKDERSSAADQLVPDAVEKCAILVESGSIEQAKKVCAELARNPPQDIATRRRIGAQLLKLGMVQEAGALLFDNTDIPVEDMQKILNSGG